MTATRGSRSRGGARRVTPRAAAFRTARTTIVTTAAGGLLVSALALPTASADEPDPVGPQVEQLTESDDAIADSRRSASSLNEGKIAKEKKAKKGKKPKKDKELDAARQAIVDKISTDDPTAYGVLARLSTDDLDWSGSTGVREYGTTKPTNGKERFRAASITKPMVATLVMQLVEDGTWSLETTVGEVRPGLFGNRGDDITIRQLLQHTSGVPTGTQLAIALKNPGAGADLATYFETTKLTFTEQELIDGSTYFPIWNAPGVRFNYSNGGYVALGMMLQTETGQSLDRLLERRVFKPAKMNQSRYETDAKMRGPFLVGTTTTDEGIFSERGSSPTIFAASGAVSSSTKDLNNFTEALTEGRLVDPALVEQMKDTTRWGYGFGLFRVPDPCAPEGSDDTLVGHDGASIGTLSATFSSEDGTRQATVVRSSRAWDNSAVTQSRALTTAAQELMATTC